MNPKNKVLREYEKRFGTQPAFISWAPGRVNLMGEHVDYNDGFVLPAAIDRMTWLAFSASGTENSTILAADLSSEIHLNPQFLKSKCDCDQKPLSGWALYPAGIQWVLTSDKRSTPGMNAVFASEVPRGAGLSSSASVELAFCLAWQRLGKWTCSEIELARLAQTAESQYVGVHCGIMDQYASICGRRGYALYLDCRVLTSRDIAMPPQVSIVMADSGIRHHLADGIYNERRVDCEEALCLLRERMPGIKALRDVTPEQLSIYSEHLTERLRPIARHVIEEIERTSQSVRYLEKGDMHRFGELMEESHASLRDLYRVSCPELDLLVRIAVDLEGCYGARMTGAGFGGCTVNLVENRVVNEFIGKLEDCYHQLSGLKAVIYPCQTSDGAGVTSL